MSNVKKDCFAYNKKECGVEECTALTKLYCKKKKKCNFYKVCSGDCIEGCQCPQGKNK